MRIHIIAKSFILPVPFLHYIFSGVGENPSYAHLYNTIKGDWNELRRRPGDRGIALRIQIPIWDWGVNWANVQAAGARQIYLTLKLTLIINW
jgi:hypothetical protein